MTDDAAPPKRHRPNLFQPGQSGNPAGKPKGSRNHTLLALDAIGSEGAEAVLRKVVSDAISGDMRAAEVLLSRVWPTRKGRPVTLDLPRVVAAADIPAALGAVVESVSRGALTPDEGQAVAALLNHQRQAIETADLEARLAALEAANGEDHDASH